MKKTPWNFSYLLILTAAILFISSCAPKVQFTQSIREKYKLTENEIRALQFYNSHDIVLNRGERKNEEQGTEEGTLTIKTGNYIEQVTIKAGTPGIVEKVIDGKRIAVSYEVGEGNFLVFGSTNPENRGRYTILASEWVNNKGKLEYGGKTFYAAPGSGNIYLLFKMRKLHQYRKEERVVKGRKI